MPLRSRASCWNLETLGDPTAPANPNLPISLLYAPLADGMRCTKRRLESSEVESPALQRARACTSSPKLQESWAFPQPAQHLDQQSRNSWPVDAHSPLDGRETEQAADTGGALGSSMPTIAAAYQQLRFAAPALGSARNGLAGCDAFGSRVPQGSFGPAGFLRGYGMPFACRC